jgi:hypothetical protein
MLAASIIKAMSEISVNFYQTTRRNIPDDSHLHTRRRENLKSQPAYRLNKLLRKEKTSEQNADQSSVITKLHASES